MVQTILLVEDDPSLRRLSERVLTKFGYKVIVCDGAASAITTCRDCQDSIELLITDVFMPEMRGPELARQLTAMRPAMKVLYVSGSNQALVDDGLLTQGSNFLQKPFTTEQFSKKIKEILGRE